MRLLENKRVGLFYCRGVSRLKQLVFKPTKRRRFSSSQHAIV
jgi:hypothetical protein